MRVYSNITIDMQHPRALQTVHMMQGDRSARYVSVMLTDHGAKWMVPKECKQVSVSFCKPDGKGGTYTKLQSGAYACEWTANWINVGIHPQALTTAGFVWCNITLLAADGSALGIYPFVIDVIARPASRITSTDYLDAVSDARLVLVRADLPTDQTQISVARSACLLAPRPGDLALGANGYLGKITDTDATQATVEGLGMVWGPTESFNPGSITPASIGAIPVPTAYKAEEDAVLAVAAVDAAGQPTKWRYRNMPDSLFFAPEIEIPGKPYAADDATTEIDLGGYALLPETAVRVGATVVGKNGYMAEVTALNGDGDPVVRSTGDRLISNGFDGLFYTTYGANEFLRVAEVDADGKPVGFYSTSLQRLIAVPDADVPTEYNSAIKPDASKLAALGDVDGYPAQPHVGDYVVGKNGYIAKMVSSDASGYPVVAGVGARLIAPPPHVVITLTGSGNSWTIGSATLSGKAVTLTNATGKADYSALIAAINKAVPEGGAVELQYSGALYTAQTSRNELSVLLSYLDICDPTSVTDGCTLLRVRLTADAATVTVTEI